MSTADVALRPWLDRLARDVGPIRLFDAHTHIGQNDPDGFKQTPEELIAVMEAAGARAVTFPMHEPGGYPAANDAAVAAAAGSGGRLVAFCRVDPRTGDAAVAEARRNLDAGAVGIKLHPRAEGFTMAEPAVRDLVALAHERRRPILIHAGRGIPALGRDTVRLAAEFPDARFILAHAAISDLAWLTDVLPELPNVLIDTSWWNPGDFMALFCLAPPASILWASDSPYGTPVTSAVVALRLARQAGLGGEAIRAIAGGQFERVVAGEDLLQLGPPPGPPQQALHPVYERIVSNLVAAVARAFVPDGGMEESVALARLACAVGERSPQAGVASRVLGLLDRFEEGIEAAGGPVDGRPLPDASRFLLVALAVARTPDVPMPDEASAPAPVRDAAEPG